MGKTTFVLETLGLVFPKVRIFRGIKKLSSENPNG